MLRIHLTTVDAMKVRVVVLGVVAELQLSLTRLQHPDKRVAFEDWRARTATLAGSLSYDVREMARFLAPPGHGLVDLFTLVGAVDSYAEGIDRLCEAPLRALRAELSYTPAVSGIRSAWMDDVAHGNRTARQRLVGALTDYHDAALAPYWPRIRTLLEKERAARFDVMARHGLDTMLAGLAPTLRWNAPVLEVPDLGSQVKTRDPKVSDVYLRGRGLLLAPSLFARPDPGLFVPWNDDPAVLIYPVEVDAVAAAQLWLPSGEPRERALSGLLGATRAAALQAIAHGCTTTELARRLRISPGGASQHAAILREAGLVASRRHRNTVRHTITRLGLDLLNAA